MLDNVEIWKHTKPTEGKQERRKSWRETADTKKEILAPSGFPASYFSFQ